MRVKVLFNILIAVVLLTACQKGGDPGAKGGPSPTQGQHSPNGQTDNGGVQGPSDTGGGNGVKGRPLDSYIVNILERPEVASIILALIDKVSVIHSGFAGAMYHILTARTWYLVPVSLDRIPSANIGVHFQTQQMALHKLKAIWIDQTLFEPMPELDRVTLLVHEIVMGIRALKFNDIHDRCMAQAAGALYNSDVSSVAPEDGKKIKQAAYDSERKKCHKDEAWRIESNGEVTDLVSRIKLSEADYDDVRNMTGRLVQIEMLSPTTEELDLWLLKSKLSGQVTRKVKDDGEKIDSGGGNPNEPEVTPVPVSPAN